MTFLLSVFICPSQSDNLHCHTERSEVSQDCKGFFDCPSLFVHLRMTFLLPVFVCPSQNDNLHCHTERSEVSQDSSNNKKSANALKQLKYFCNRCKIILRLDFQIIYVEVYFGIGVPSFAFLKIFYIDYLIKNQCRNLAKKAPLQCRLSLSLTALFCCKKLKRRKIMKNKIKQMFVILSMLTLLIVAFAGCELQHSHSFGNWEHNSNNHYKFCDCGETWGDGAHEFADGICSVCGYSQIKPHTHVFDQQVATEAFLKTTATCTAKATYYYSCECGEKGSDTFEGDFLHNFTSEVVEEKYLHTQATCASKAVYYKSCSVCGEKGSETFEYGELGDHDFANNQACTVCNATYGLKYELNEDGESYSVVGIDNATATEIVVPKFYNKKPVTSIGEWAFANCSSLISVTIPNSVTSIGECAFYYCDSLTSVIIGNNVTSIGDDAFNYCTSLTSVTIGESVTSIGNGAFNWCRSLTKVNYTGTIDEWAQISFGSLSANPIYYAKSLYINDVLVRDVKLTTATKISALAFYFCYSLTSIEIPNSVTSIGNGAFYGCSSLTSVTIGNSVTTIGNYAFEGCSSLTSVTIGNSVTSIGDSAFGSCRSLTSVTIPDSVTSIGNGAFYGCRSLTSVTIPDSVTSIGYKAFYSCGSLTSIVLPDSVTSIGEYAFGSCSSLTSVTIGNNVTSIGNSAFYYCYKLVEVVNNSSHITVTKGSRENGHVGYYALAVYNSGDTFVSKLSNDNGYIVYTDGQEKILVGYDGKETSLTLPTYITQIYDYAFYNSSLTSITIPNSVTSIGDYAFRGCYKLVEVVNRSSYITLTIGSTSNGYAGYYALAVYNSGDTFVSKLSNDNGYIVYTDGQEKILVGYDGKETSLTLPTYITQIYDYAFYNSSLTSITIPNSVTSIGKYAFYGCSSLTSVTILDSVTTIGDSAFGFCSSLTSITIPDSVTTIGDSAFVYCTSLTSVTIPDSVTSIGWYAFEFCYSLTSVTIGNSVTSIGEEAFRGCSSLTSIIIPNSVTTIGDSAFSSCSSLTSVTIPDSVTSIGWYAFEFCYSLTSVTIGNSVTSIGEGAFFYCSSLTSITIPDSVTSIGEYAFAGCSSLTSITIPDSVTSIGDWAFSSCSSLTSVYYMGTASQWSKISIGADNDNLKNTTIYYYSETQPTESGNYWHFATDGKTPIVWKKEN